MNKLRPRGQTVCYHRPSSYSPRSVGANLQFFDQPTPTARPRRPLGPPEAAPPGPQTPVEEQRLRFPPPTNDQPQQELFERGLPGSKPTTLILSRRLTPNEREELVADHWSLVSNLLENYKPTGLPLKAEAGLATAAQIGLIAAAESFEDHRPKWQFTVYAQTAIIDEIRSELRSYQLSGS